jgi:hypothetical protein
MAAGKLAPTDEQQAVLDAVGSGGTVAISAAAGSGKTSTLRMIADAGANRRMLYVAYNKAIQIEAERSFPANVTCKTAHALAYRAFGAPIRARLGGPRMTGTQTAKVLGIGGSLGFSDELVFTPAAQASLAMGMVARFCRTASSRIEPWHLHPPEGLSDEEAKTLATRLLPYACRAWEDLTAGAAGRLRPTHDVYLKQWQLSGPELTGWDVILYDEAQDADPCVADVIEHQAHAQLVAVGDSAQAIYGWRGAGDFLARVRADHRLALTQSWRFGPAVADEANVWLGVIGTDLRVRGNPGRDSTLGPVEAPDAILCRSNAGTIEALMDAHDTGRKVHLVGDGKEMLSLAYAAARLQEGKPAGHPELVAFSSWEQLVEYAEHDPAGSDLAVAVRMIDRYGTDGVIGAVEGTVPAGKAELVVSTAHRAKGLEWDRVRIASGYREPLDKHTGRPLPIAKADAMLAYVSVTRARHTLDTGGLAWVHGHLATLSMLPAEITDSRRALTVTPNTIPTETGRTAKPAPSPPPVPVGVGDEILVAGEHGTFTVRGVARDGSYVAYATSGQGGARSFRPEWCVPAWREPKRTTVGRVRVRQVPAAARQARADWQTRHRMTLQVSESELPPTTGAGLAVER